MNKDAYDRLPRELKTVIDNNSGQVAAGMAGAMWDLQAGAVAEMVAERGDTIVTLLPEAVAHWRKATEPTIAIWLKEMKEQKVDGAKLLASARAALAKYESLPEPQPAQTPPPQQEVVTEQPQGPQQVKSDAVKPDASVAGPVTPPKAASPAAPSPQPPAAAVKPTPQPPVAAVKPVAQPAPVPHVAARAPAAPAPVATPAQVAPVAKPIAPAPPTVAAAPPTPPPALPAAKPVPKALDFPL
jgi:hypothetical protein